MRRALITAGMVLIGLVGCTSEEPTGRDVAAIVAPLRPIDLCGNGIDEDGDGTDRVCAADAPLGPASVAVLRGIAEQPSGDYFDAEVRLVPDGDPSCSGAPTTWPSVEGCVGRASCSIQLTAKVRLTSPSTGALAGEYALTPRRCSGGTGGTDTSQFTWSAQDNRVIYSGTSFGLGAGSAGLRRLSLRSTESGTLTGAGDVMGTTGTFTLDFAGVE